MIVCSCRNISDRSFRSDKELLKRLREDDKECSKCVWAITQEIRERSLTKRP